MIGWQTPFDPLLDPRYRMTTAAVHQDYMASVPEPASRLPAILDFGLVGAAMRRPAKVRAGMRVGTPAVPT